MDFARLMKSQISSSTKPKDEDGGSDHGASRETLEGTAVVLGRQSAGRRRCSSGGCVDTICSNAVLAYCAVNWGWHSLWIVNIATLAGRVEHGPTKSFLGCARAIITVEAVVLLVEILSGALHGQVGTTSSDAIERLERVVMRLQDEAWHPIDAARSKGLQDG